MENFSNDPIENVAINALYREWSRSPFLTLRNTFLQKTLQYRIATQKWTITETKHWEDGASNYRGVFVNLPWAQVKEQIIDFLCEAKPDLERELLRARQEEILTAPLALETL